MKHITRLICFMAACVIFASIQAVYALAPTPTLTAEPSSAPLTENLEAWIDGSGDHRLVTVDWSGLTVMTSATPTPMPTAEPTPQPEEPDLRCSIDVNSETAEAHIRIVNTYDENKSVVVYVAQYNEAWAVIGVKYEEIIVPALTITPAEYTVRADKIMENKQYVKAFVWEELVPVKLFE